MDISVADDGRLALRIPTINSDNYHTVFIPMTLNGLYLLRDMLTRNQLRTNEKIGDPLAPTQALVDQWMKTDRAAKAEEEAAENKRVKAYLEESGLNKVRIAL